jgi:hypothetical protein
MINAHRAACYPLPGQDISQAHLVSVSAVRCLVVRDLVDDGTRLGDGTRGAHQPVAGGAQIDAVSLRGHITHAQDVVPPRIQTGGLQVDGEESHLLAIGGPLGEGCSQLVR